MLKAVIFDMDGVVVDTEPLHYKAYHKMFDDVNINVDEALYASFTGQSTQAICQRLCAHFHLEDAPERLVQLKRKHFEYLFDHDESLTLIDGVRERIEEYYEHGITLVLASSASMPNINRVFKRFDLDRYFNAKLSGADLPKSKPHPQIFINAAKASGYTKKECIVIEDSTNGIKAAHDAGIYCVGFKSPHSSGQDYQLADKVITDFKEITYEKLQYMS
ncbi:MAG: HAD family phosphatase [Winogradskyella sp.]|nr:HAD family phosphatase [Winogradskyella sp.]